MPERLPVTGALPQTAWRRTGHGEPVILIHGVGMAQSVWQPQVDALSRDHDVVVYDMLGHGDSTLPAEGATLAAYAAQLADLMDHLGIKAANIVGHSMGALIALEFALTQPKRTLRVAALNAVFERTPEQRAAVQARAEALKQSGFAATIGPTIDRWFGTPVPARLRDAADLVAGLLTRVSPTGYARTYRLFASSDAVHASRLPTLAMPALFLTGEFDANSSPAMSRAMGDLAPNAVVEILPDARHTMNLTHPDEVNASLRTFLAMPRDVEYFDIESKNQEVHHDVSP